ncbi:MAG: twin-arginine translocation pathway signal protein [Caldilineaceae bacterium]
MTLRRGSWLAVLLAIAVLLVGACAAPAAPAPAASEASSGEAQEAVASGPVELNVWAEANDVEHWRADGPAKAAEMVTDFDITVTPLNDDAGWADYKKKFTLAADAGEAPDIVLSGHEDVPVWANAGYIVDFGFCKEKYPEFADVIDSLWEAATWHGNVWAVPQDTEARPMFYNKAKLAELGWSQEEIDSLPDRIMNGEFTLDDMIATAKEAIDAGVVEPGYGYWHRPTKGGDYLQYYFSYGGKLYDAEQDKLVVDQEALQNWYAFQRRVVEVGITPENYIGTEFSIWHDTVSHGNVLFWNGGIWQWADWAKNYVADLGGQDYLFDFVGFALQPSGIKGQPGGTLSHPLVYMITSEKASGAANQEAACALLAKTTTPEINTLHAVESTHLGILKSQADYEDYASDRLLSETLYMLDHNYYQPNHVMYGPYFDIVWDFMVKAENGDLSPEEAANGAVELLQAELGDQVIVQ